MVHGNSDFVDSLGNAGCSGFGSASRLPFGMTVSNKVEDGDSMCFGERGSADCFKFGLKRGTEKCNGRYIKVKKTALCGSIRWLP